MSDQPEALRLADALRDGMPFDEAEIENELRRLHEKNTALLKDLRYIADHDLRDVDLSICGHIAHALVGKARDAIEAIEGEKE